MSVDPEARSELERDAVAAADRVAGDARGAWWVKFAGRWAGRLLGAVLIVAGILKALHPLDFAREIAGYGILTDAVGTGMLAFALIVVECGLGAALLVSLRPRLMLGLTVALLVVFLGAITIAWSTGAATECGCFGPWKRSMPVAFVQDVVLIAIAVWAWVSHAGISMPVNAIRLAVVGLALVAGVSVPAIATMSSMAAPGSLGVVGSTAFQTIEVTDAPASLASGEHLILLMSTECAHCREAVPAVNLLVSDGRLPKLTAVAMEDRVERGLFQQDLHAAYPIAQISRESVSGLVGRQFPRLFLVRDGRILAVWDEAIPTPDEIVNARSKA